MKWNRLTAIVVWAFLGLVSGPVSAGGGWSVGIGIGGPGYYPYPRPWGYGYYRYPGIYYRPGPVILETGPVVVQPAPVIQQVPVVTQPTYVTQPYAPAVVNPPANSPAVPHPPTYSSNQAILEGHLQQLGSNDANARVEAALQLGRLKAQTATSSLETLLRRDPSPAVREAAARALGLIGSPQSLTVLKYAAQSDEDEKVRHSAVFSIDIIQSNMSR